MIRLTPWRSPLAIALAGTASLVMALGIGRFMLTPALPSMISDTALTAVSAGHLAAINYAGYLIGAVLAMTIPNRHARSALFAGLVLSLLTTAAMGLTENITLWAVNRVLAGVASAIIMVNGSALVLAALPNRYRARLSNVHYAGIGLGISIAAVIVLIIEDMALGFSWMWLSAAALLLLTLPLLAKLPPLPSSKSRPSDTPDKPLLAIILLTLSYGFAGLGYITSTTFLPVIATETLPQLARAGFYVWIAVGLAAIPANLLWGKIAYRIGESHALMLALVVQAVGVSATLWLPGLYGLLVSGILVGGTFTAVVALSMYCGRQLLPQSPSMVLGALTASYGVGQIAGPLLTASLLAKQNSFSPGLLASSAALLCAALLLLPLRQRVFNAHSH